MVTYIDAGAWVYPSQSRNKPAGRGLHSSTIADSKLYVYGGWTMEKKTPICSSTIYVYDLGNLQLNKNYKNGYKMKNPKMTATIFRCRLHGLVTNLQRLHDLTLDP